MLVLLPPVVSVALPRLTVPAPAREPMLWLKLLRSNVAPLWTVTALLLENAPLLPASRLPASMLVLPV